MALSEVSATRPQFPSSFLLKLYYLINTNHLKTCIFCPNVDGAFKQTNTLRWSHLLCAIWIPEVSLGNTTFMEPVMDVEKVPKQRWKLVILKSRSRKFLGLTFAALLYLPTTHGCLHPV